LETAVPAGNEHRGLEVKAPDWVHQLAPDSVAYGTDEERMRVAIRIARENVTRGNGGPFGAAVFHRDSGRLVGAGVNLVLAYNCSVLHAEIVAIMLAESRLGSLTLSAEDGSGHELVTSCEPCAMCLGAVHWSGVSRLVIGASRVDVEQLKFDEGPVFPESYRYLEARGLTITRDVCRAEAREVLEMYARMNGKIY
jgi:tRNA(Arg) A34 adenosine deaminase TadA